MSLELVVLSEMERLFTFKFPEEKTGGEGAGGEEENEKKNIG